VKSTRVGLPAMEAGELLATLRAGAMRFAVPLSQVDRVISAAMPVAVPGAPSYALRVGDELLPLYFGAALFGADEVTLGAQDKVVVLTAGSRRLAFWVDAVEDIV